MTLTKETIEKAVNWWVEKVTANQPHSNGDNGLHVYCDVSPCGFYGKENLKETG